MVFRGGTTTCGLLLVASMLTFGCDPWSGAGAERTTIPEQGLLARTAMRSTHMAFVVGTHPTVADSVVPAVTKQRRKYVTRRPSVGKRTQTVAEATVTNLDAFHSPEDCLTLLRRGERASRVTGTVRIASWNVRWFPDGVPGNPTQASRATDVDWMACAIGWMNVDAVALAEIKSKPRSELALERLTARLDELTNGKYVVHTDDCPDENGQHVAWLVNQQRVTASDWQLHASINPNGNACAGQLRPGLGVKLRFASGLDLHAIAVHLKSGVEPRDIELRRTSIDGIERALASVTAQSGDADVLVAGDFNTMGCRGCSEVSRSAAEASWLDTRLKAFHPEARRVPSDLGCSLYYQRQPSLLDHFIVTTAMQEAPVGQVATVYGHCRELGCEAYSGKEPEAVLHLSDHCPIVLALLDQDQD
jgi:endonuclease/exonuclease/phosphatase family metal-dependent hydrolase